MLTRCFLRFESSFQKVGLLYEENWSAGKAMLPYVSKKDAFIHFTDYDKMVPNPSPDHLDPVGIYFYPVKWLLNNAKFGQYALGKDNYYIVRVNLSKVVKLKNFSLEDGEAIASKNGWLEYFRKGVEDRSLIRSTYPKELLKGRTEEAALFYAIADTLANTSNFGKKMTWSQTLRGVKGIYDNTNKGIINTKEPSQLLVLDPSIIKVEESGENYELTGEKLQQVYTDITKDLGGQFKEGISDFVIDGNPLKIIWDGLTFEFFQEGFKRSVTKKIPLEVFNRSLTDLKKYFTYLIDNFLSTTELSSSSDFDVERYLNLAKRLGVSSNWRVVNKVDQGDFIYSGSINNIFGFYWFEFRVSKTGSVAVTLSASVDYDYPLVSGELVPIKHEYKFNDVFSEGISDTEIISTVGKDLRKFLESLNSPIPILKLKTLFQFSIPISAEDKVKLENFKNSSTEDIDTEEISRLVDDLMSDEESLLLEEFDYTYGNMKGQW